MIVLVSSLSLSLVVEGGGGEWGRDGKSQEDVWRERLFDTQLNFVGVKQQASSRIKGGTKEHIDLGAHFSVMDCCHFFGWLNYARTRRT